MISAINRFLFLTGSAAIIFIAPILRGSVRVWSITPFLVIAGILFFLALLDLVARGGRLAEVRTVMDIPILIFTVISFVSLAQSVYKHDSVYAMIKLISYIALYYAVVLNYGRRNRRFLIYCAIFSGAGLSIYALTQYINMLPHGWWVPEKFMAATYVNHNHFAGYLELVIPVTIGTLLRYKKMNTFLRGIFYFGLVMMFTAFVISQSRGGWVCLGFSLFIMLIMLYRNGQIRITGVILIIGLVAMVIGGICVKKGEVFERIASFGEVHKGEASLSTRFKIWEGASGMIEERPVLGFGPGDFDWGFYRYKPRGLNVLAQFAHNDYIQVAAEIGLFGVPVLLWILIRILRLGFRMSSHPVMLGCAAGILSLSLHGLIDFNFYIPANVLLFTIYIGIISGQRKLAVAGSHGREKS